MINIIIIDDHELFRLGLKTAIQLHHPDIAIAGEAGSGHEFFNLLETTTADIVLLDIMLPDMSGIDIARRLKNEQPQIKILAISAENNPQTVEEILNIGIEGFISKFNSNPNILADAIRSISQGVDYLGKDISEIISRIYLSKKKTKQITHEFTEQEKHIIEYCMEGLSGKLIADRLNISMRTVDCHKSNIFRKLGINSTIEMVKYAIKNGII